MGYRVNATAQSDRSGIDTHLAEVGIVSAHYFCPPVLSVLLYLIREVLYCFQSYGVGFNLL